ncbi:S8 family serine peptidase [Paenibacillus sp.]|uniref:S8 family serine peptidase n=1 Tax=Paenibacillus sp. TaxID=58172 RepID=UPI002D7563CC|nr:S8 family serine peptidase [Paenibacillus sp.]HZG56134.1 S8 family serine peptidase [Paenibacillus sp.]
MRSRNRNIRTKASWLLTAALLAQTLVYAGGAGAAEQPAEEAFAEEAFAPKLSALEAHAKKPYVEGEVLVTYKPSVKTADKSRLRQSFALSPKQRIASMDAELLKLPEGADVEETVAKLKSSGLVEHAQPNYRYYPSEIVPPVVSDHVLNWGLQNEGQLIPNDPGYGITGTYGIDIGSVRALNSLNKNELKTVIVAVIDTGVDTSHPELQGKIWTNPGEIAENLIDDDGNGYVDDVHGWDFANGNKTIFDNAVEDLHGTHVAATIAGAQGNGGASGVAPNVQIMPLKFIGENGSGTTAEVVEAIAYAASMGAKISNNSWNGFSTAQRDALLLEAIEAADMLFVGSAGNGDRYGEGVDTDIVPVSPNNLRSSKQLTVAAVDPSGNLAKFSNYGDETVHIGAPGVAIYNAVPGGEYDFLDGTSMAAPHVAGVAAVLMGQKNLTPLETKQLILDSARALPDLAGKTVSGKLVNLLYPIGTTATNVQVSLEKPLEFQSGAVELSFRTSKYGGMQAGRDSVSIMWSGFVSPPGAITYENISVNGVPIGEADLISDGIPLRIRMPVSVGHQEVVVVRFESGLNNAVAGSYFAQVTTSVDTGYASGTYVIEEDTEAKVVRLDRSGMPSTMPADRSVEGVIRAEIANDKFTGVVGESFEDKLLVNFLPDGVNVAAVKESDTSVTISVYGVSETSNPAEYMVLSFQNAAFESGNASNVKNSSSHFFFWFYSSAATTSPQLTFKNQKFIESDANDGSIQTTATAILTGGSFAGSVGSLLTDEQVQFEGVPEGLTASARIVHYAAVQIELSGEADAHAITDSGEGMSVTFLDAAFVNPAAATVLPSNTFEFLFKDAPGTPGNVQAQQDGAFVDISWSEAADAEYYAIMAAEEDERFFQFDATTETSYTDILFGVVPAEYQYRIDAYKGKVATKSDAVTVALSADYTYYEGTVGLNGRQADQTKLTIRNPNGTIRHAATFDAANPNAALFSDYGIGRVVDEDGNIVENTLFVYFYAPNGTYQVQVENGTWTAQSSVSTGADWMLGEQISDFELALYHVGLIGTLTLAAPSGNNNGGGGFIPPPPPEKPIQQNPDGDYVYKPSATKETREGAEVAVAKLTADDLAKALEADADATGKLVIELETEGAAEVSLPVGALAAAEGFPVVEVKTSTASYRVPKALLDPAALAAKFGVAAGAEWTAVVQMSPVTGASAAAIGSSAASLGANVVGTPIHYSMSVQANGQTFEYDSFGNTYVERTAALDRSVNARNATAALYDPATGALTFVPATFETRGGKTTATMKRNGNSVYVVLESQRSFADLASHWAKSDIELLAGKLVLNGTGADTFSPNAPVTRAEFAAMLTRALGLTGDAEAATFTDVIERSWYEGAVGAAAAAGLVTGYEDGTFRPNERVTREQMAVMFERAMRFAGGELPTSGGASFADQTSISPWAAKAVATVSAAGIVGGNPDGTFAPAAEANRAEAAVMLKRLLQRLAFLN